MIKSQHENNRQVRVNIDMTLVAIFSMGVKMLRKLSKIQGDKIWFGVAVKCSKHILNELSVGRLQFCLPLFSPLLHLSPEYVWLSTRLVVTLLTLATSSNPRVI